VPFGIFSFNTPSRSRKTVRNSLERALLTSPEHRAIAIRHTLHLKSGELAISQFCLRTIVVFRHTYIQEKAFDLKSDRPKEFDLPFKKVLLE
jgi:hypothetical protein